MFDEIKTPQVHTNSQEDGIGTAGKQPILTRGIGYTRIGHRTGRRVFFERIETDDVTTVLTRREDSDAVICLHRKPHTKSGKSYGQSELTKVRIQRQQASEAEK